MLPQQPRWKWTSNGDFSTASTYIILMESGISMPHNLALWSLKIPTKIRIFLWVAMQDKLLTQQNLSMKGCAVPLGCHLCSNSGMETTGHLLHSCTFAIRLWQILAPQSHPLTQTDELHLFWWTPRETMSKTSRAKWDATWAAGCWNLWKERNRRLFSSKRRRVEHLAQEAKQEATQWLSVSRAGIG